MKKIQIKLIGLSLFMMTMLFSSCTDDLSQSPDTGDSVSSDELFSNPASYKQYLAKLYAGFATTGQQGPAGSPDISGIDEGTSQYIRGYWMMQELTTDEAVIAWNDGTIKDFHSQTWTSSDTFIAATFSRFSFQIVNCNEFLRQTTDDKLTARGITDTALLTEIKTYRAEARFLRAMTYWHLVDTFGGGSLVTENSPSTFYYPDYATRADIYKFIDDELTAVTADLKAPRTNEQYRIDQAAAWMLQAKLYMNAKIYIGSDHYAEAIPLINKVISSGYTLHNNYNQLFYADNDKNGAQNEFIFAIAYDGINTQTYGGTTFLTHAPVGGEMPIAEFGISGGWGGIRTTSAFVDTFGANNSSFNYYKFDTNYKLVNNKGLVFDSNGVTSDKSGFDSNKTYLFNSKNGKITLNSVEVSAPSDAVKLGVQQLWNDTRIDAFTVAQTLEIKNIGSFTDGYAIRKFRNVDVNGEMGSDKTGTFSDSDFPIFRLADAYLMYAECAVRGAGGDLATATNYVNALRTRANATTISQSALTLNFILDERARELHWEGQRRTDLIRFGKFSGGSYLWPWKGNVSGGAPTQAYRNLFPIPAGALSANQKLQQNPGY